jgi:soluble lytic murein transglycosylase-like protein
MFIFSLYTLLLAGLPLLAAQQSVSVTAKPEQAIEESLQKQRESVQKQQQAIRRQLGEKSGAEANPITQFIDPLPALIQAPCAALKQDKLGELVAVAAQKHSLDPALLTAVMRQESAFNPCAVSVKGALGLMQLMPATALELHVADVFNPEQNIQGGAAYLKQLLDRYKGDLRLALVGYNAGPGRADQQGAAPYPLETQNYVASILAELGIVPADRATPDINDQEMPPTDTGIPAGIALPVPP